MPVKSYKDGNGKTKYYASFYYTDYTGQRKKKKKEGFATAAAAKQFERDFIDQHNGSSDILFKNLVENYLADCRQRQKPTTLLAKESRIKKYITPFFSDLPISEITPLHVRKWQNEILQKEYKPGTVRMIHASLAAVLNYAVKYYGLQRNPATLAGSIGTRSCNIIRFLAHLFSLLIQNIMSPQADSRAECGRISDTFPNARV